MSQPKAYDLEMRMEVLAALGAEADIATRCIDTEFQPCPGPDALTSMGFAQTVDDGADSSQRMIEAVHPDDWVGVMDALSRVLRNGVSFVAIAPTALTGASDDGPVGLHFVDMLEHWGVIVSVIGGEARPIGTHDAADTEPAAPRRIVQHRDQSAHIHWVDSGTEQLLGWKPEDMVGQSALSFLVEADHERAIEGWIGMLAGEHRDRVRLRYIKADGDPIWLEVTQTNHLDDPELGYVEVELIDVNDEMLALAQARSGEQQFAILTESLPVGIVQVNAEAEIVYLNGWLREMFRPLHDDRVNPVGEIHPNDRADFFAAFRAAIASGEGSNVDARIIHGATRVEHMCRARIRSLGEDDAGQHRGAIASVEDLTETLDLQAKLKKQANSDYLTGLPNRSALMEWLEDHLESEPSGENVHGGATVFFFDLDGFKRLNDTMGHEAGDVLLQAVSRRTLDLVRPTDLLARIGGDEFVIACESQMSNEACALLGDRLLASFDGSIIIDNRTADIGVSIGIARSQGLDAETVLGNADIAMYEAKRAGGRQWSLFQDGLRDRLELQFHTEHEIRNGIANNNFTLHLQPVVDLTNGLTVAAEALIRLQHPVHGLLGPHRFLPAAERSGLIVPLGRWIVVDACRLARRLADEFINPCRITINLSAKQLLADGFHEEMMTIVATSGVEPQQIILEVTESALIDTSDEIMFVLADLADAGMTIALDDFGTGFSSLNHLRLIPAQMVKIDGAYTADLGIDRGTTAITEAMVGLSKSLGQELVVEGIEEPHQLARVREMGVELGQGFLLARPMPEEEFFSIDRSVTRVEAFEAHSRA